MKKTVLVYGHIAGIICGGTLGISGMLNSGSLNFENGMYFGFASMILAAIIMWVGMAAYKKNLGGSISFGKAVGAGVLMALIASSMYVFTWMAMYRTAFAGFGEKYAAYAIESLKKSGKSEAEVAKKEQEIRENMERYDSNPVYRVGVTYMEILPLQIVIVLIAGAVLSRKKKGGPAAA